MIEPFHLSVTTTALDKIHEFLQDRQPTPLGIRVSVQKSPGGVQHGLNFVEDITPMDQIFEIGGVTFVTDPQSALFLNNMTMDFVTTDAGSGFVFQSGCSGRSCFNCRGACRGQRPFA